MELVKGVGKIQGSKIHEVSPPRHGAAEHSVPAHAQLPLPAL